MRRLKMRDKRKQIDWPLVWEHFDKWIDEKEEGKCSKCKSILGYMPEWDDQQKKIKELVERQMQYISYYSTTKQLKGKKV
jgi:hypothetical protein